MKDPNAPKRPLSGYMRFIGTIRKQVVEETGLKGIKVTPILSKKWKELTEEERQAFNAQFKVEMQEHKKVMAAYKQTEEYRQFQENKKSKKFKKKPKDKNAPKRPTSAYFMFLNDARPEIMKELGSSASIGEVGKRLGEEWHKLDAKTKAAYTKKSEKARAVWQKKVKAYRKTPKYAKWLAHKEELKQAKNAALKKEKNAAKEAKKSPKKRVQKRRR
jgi:hypothetical protein